MSQHLALNKLWTEESFLLKLLAAVLTCQQFNFHRCLILSFLSQLSLSIKFAIQISTPGWREALPHLWFKVDRFRPYSGDNAKFFTVDQKRASTKMA